jgi:tetratricopeptide (TPR) repeat protein
MRRCGAVMVLLLVAALPAAAQLGKQIGVPVGTPEDHALTAINATKDPQQKLALIEKFAAAHPQGNMALMADRLFVNVYSTLKNYAKACEYGEKALALDPNDLETAVEGVRAAQLRNNAQEMYFFGIRVGQMVARYNVQPAPPGLTAAGWAVKKKETLENVKPQVDWVAGVLYDAAMAQSSADTKAALLERFVTAFPGSSYAQNAPYQIAAAYERAGETDKLVVFARKRIAANPNEIAMRLVLADYWSQKGIDLDQAEAAAKKVLAILAQQTKPAGTADGKPQEHSNTQEGLAYSVLGQIYVRQKQNRKAIKAFERAEPLLKSDTAMYARNLYRLGFTLALIKRYREARRVLTEAAATHTPYSQLAEGVLKKLPGGHRR